MLPGANVIVQLAPGATLSQVLADSETFPASAVPVKSDLIFAAVDIVEVFTTEITPLPPPAVSCSGDNGTLFYRGVTFTRFVRMKGIRFIRMPKECEYFSRRSGDFFKTSCRGVRYRGEEHPENDTQF